MKRLALLCLMAGLLVGPSYFAAAQESQGASSAPGSSKAKPDYRRMMLLNSILPGTAQLELGEPREALLYAVATPLSLVGQGITLYVILARLGGIHLTEGSGSGSSTLFSYGSEPTTLDSVLLYSGFIAALYGELLGSYSQYAAFRDYEDRYGLPFTPALQREGRPSLGTLLLAPFRPRNVFRADILPVLALTTLSAVTPADFGKIGDYFKRTTVPFMGTQVSPLAGLGLRFLTAGVLVWANATWEEIAFRGLALESDGPVYSSLSFGLAHLGNMLQPGVTVTDTLLQSVFATAFGFYASDVASRGENGLEQTIALHFWNNMLAFVLNYLVDPATAWPFAITWSVHL